MERYSASSSKYRAIPSVPVKERPRKGASWGRPCSWIRGVGWMVNVDRRVDMYVGDVGGEVRAWRRDWIGVRRVVRGVIFEKFYGL